MVWRSIRVLLILRLLLNAIFDVGYGLAGVEFVGMRLLHGGLFLLR